MKKLMNLSLISMIGLVFWTSQISLAAVYQVDRVIGPGRITGTIETNGAIGILSSSDIVDWNLTIDADGDQATVGLLLGPTSGNNSSVTFLEGSALTATASGLFFDFSLLEFAILQIATPLGDVVWQLQAEIFSDELIQEDFGIQAYAAYPPENQQLATTMNPRECGNPTVSFGEVMSGLQAGFTGGSITDKALPSGFYLGVSGIDQRGFIDPETGSGWKCNSDWGLISAWAATNFGNDGNTRREALDFAEAVIPAVRIEIDALEQDIIMTNAKLGRLPLQYGGGDGALKSWGAFIQPHSLAPGLHEATSYYGVDLDCFPIGIGDCDGIPDIELVQSTSFEVIDD